MIDTPKVSVIIPVYNVEPYLHECLDSVVNQTLRDIEIICVNDGSTDNSGAILAEYAARDERIIVITQENRGLSAARNVGMDAAKGKYIYFIDSDDYIDLDALEVLYNRAEELKLDMLFFDFVYFYDGVEPEPWSFQREEYNGTYSGIELLKKFRDEGTYWVTVWAYLIRREFLQNSGVRYVDGMLHEDMIFTPLLMMKACRVSHLGRVFYHRRVRPNSITTGRTAKNVAGLITGMQEMLLYGLSDDRNESEALETWRTVVECQGQAKDYSRRLPEEERLSVVFKKPFTKWIHQHFVLDSIAVEDALNSLRQELAQLQGELDQQRNEAISLDAEIVRLHNENSNLLITINNLNSALTTANEKTSTAEQSAAAAWQEVDNIHRSATYRIGRAITWLPRMVRGFARCYREHGWRYTWRRVVAHIGGE